MKRECVINTTGLAGPAKGKKYEDLSCSISRRSGTSYPVFEIKYLRVRTLLLIILILTVSMTQFPEIGFALCPTYPSDEVITPKKTTIKLFNGKNLDGWYTFIKGKGRNNDPNKVFTVSNGMIRISGEEYGCITTNEEFENYKLVVEFKWGDITFAPRLDKARDSGVLLHSTGEDGGYSGIWMHSIECQVIEGGTGDIIIVSDGSDKYSMTFEVAPEKQGGSYIFQPSGSIVTLNRGHINRLRKDPEWKSIKGFHGANDIEKPSGKWNRLECVAQGDELTIYLNGILVNHSVNVKPQKGRIQIQSECAEVFFKRIEITLL